MSIPSSSNGASDARSAIRGRGITPFLALTAVLIVVLFAAFIMYLRSTRSDPCAILDGARFRAVEKVPTFDGGFQYPTLAFKNGTYQWSYSDTFSSGSYQCLAGGLIVASALDAPIEARYNPVAGDLNWNGEMYRQASVDLSPWLRYLLLFVIGIIIIQLVRRHLL